MSWFRRRHTPPEHVPAYTPAPPQAPRVPLTMAGRPAVLRRRPARLWRHGGLPFGMCVYPDSPTPAEPWFGGPTPAPDRIIVPGQRDGLGDDT